MKSLLLFFVVVSLLSCKKDNVTTNQFAGNWKGNYTGTGDNGSWKVTIGTDGNAKGSATSIVFNQTFDAVGTVSPNGQIAITIGAASSGAIFTGNLSGNNASGTWINNAKNPPYTGTWSGSKQ